MTLSNYGEFVSYVNKVGALSFHHRFAGGIARLGDLTAREQWHTGDAETDPWSWKDRAAREKTLAAGCILGGHNGFVSREAYPLFYAALSPDVSLEERYMSGSLPKTVWQAARLFEGGGEVSAFEARRALGVVKKQGVGRVNAALTLLQREFYISLCGNKQRISMSGLPYGWPANAYMLSDSYLGDWLSGAGALSKAEARARIAKAFGPAADELFA